MTSRSAWMVLTSCLLGCAGASEPPPSSAPPSSAPPTTVSITSPCAVDTDCRLYDGPACSCFVALTTATVSPSQTPCFAPPCMNQEAYCDVATHGCAVRRVPPPSEPPPSSEAAPNLGDIAPIS